jgi:ribosomal protein L3
MLRSGVIAKKVGMTRVFYGRRQTSPGHGTTIR